MGVSGLPLFSVDSSLFCYCDPGGISLIIFLPFFIFLAIFYYFLPFFDFSSYLCPPALFARSAVYLFHRITS